MSDRALGPGSKFRYYRAADTDVRRTFTRARKELAQAEEEKRRRKREEGRKKATTISFG